jgi:hypothetical protein
MCNTHSDEFSEGDVNKDIPSIPCAYQECQKVFTPRRRWQKFCCLECKDRYWREIRHEVMIVIKKRYEDHLSVGGNK